MAYLRLIVIDVGHVAWEGLLIQLAKLLLIAVPRHHAGLLERF